MPPVIEHGTTAPPPAAAPALATPEVRAPAEAPTAVGPATAGPVPEKNPGVVALLAEAEARLRQGQRDSASAALERALRLSPNDALIWHRMARLRLALGNWQQAIVFARKSESLAGSDPVLRAANAELIAEATKMSGPRK